MPIVIDALKADLDEIGALLAVAGLSAEGAADRSTRLVVAREDGRIVAVAGLEDHGRAGVLRSVAVAPDRRGRHLGTRLVTTLIERSRASGHEALYLLTKTADTYFARFGFRRIERKAVRPEVRRSPQFRDEACASSSVMVLEFGAES